MDIVTFVLILIVVLVAFGAVVTVTRQAQEKAEKGWEAASNISREVRHLLVARVTSLENRLQSSNWQEFATLQDVTDETQKSAFSEHAHAEALAYTPAQQEFLQQIINQGDDLETHEDEFGGSIIG